MSEKIPQSVGDFTTTELKHKLGQTGDKVVLWPVGSTEPHGPHLPLATDTILAEENAKRAAAKLNQAGYDTLVAPALPYGVTDFAAGFAGAISIPFDALVDFLEAGVYGYLDNGFDHVCLINHHLEPGQLKALAAVVERVKMSRGRRAISQPQVISRRWGKQLGEEFRSGACHAGAYEGSLVLAARPDLFRTEAAQSLPTVPISLSSAIQAGKTTFLEAGADAAYTGSPSHATVDEGERLYNVLTTMVMTEVIEHLEAQQ